MTTNQKPPFYVHHVVGEGRAAQWTRIGAAWPHKSGDGFNIEALGFKLVLLPPKPDTLAGPDQPPPM
jgi:hypothetical protein